MLKNLFWSKKILMSQNWLKFKSLKLSRKLYRLMKRVYLKISLNSLEVYLVEESLNQNQNLTRNQNQNLKRNQN